MASVLAVIWLLATLVRIPDLLRSCCRNFCIKCPSSRFLCLLAAVKSGGWWVTVDAHGVLCYLLVQVVSRQGSSVQIPSLPTGTVNPHENEPRAPGKGSYRPLLAMVPMVHWRMLSEEEC